MSSATRSDQQQTVAVRSLLKGKAIDLINIPIHPLTQPQMYLTVQTVQWSP